jgi:hypothetical protein
MYQPLLGIIMVMKQTVNLPYVGSSPTPVALSVAYVVMRPTVNRENRVQVPHST